jgi:hypothetical protein
MYYSTYFEEGIGGQITDCFVVPPRKDTFFLAFWIASNQCQTNAQNQILFNYSKS